MLKDVKARDPNFNIASLKSPDFSLHYLQWRYILHHSSEKVITELRKILAEVGLADDQVAKYMAMFCQSSSAKVHGTTAQLTMVEIREGLEAIGFTDVGLLNTGLAVFAVRREQKYKDELEKVLIRQTTEKP